MKVHSKPLPAFFGHAYFGFVGKIPGFDLLFVIARCGGLHILS